MSLTVAQATRIAAVCTDMAVLFRLDTPTPMRMWSGAGDFNVPPDAIEPLGAIYNGAGKLGGLPELSQLINGVAERVVFSFSGADPDIAAVADGDAFLVRNKRVNIGLLPLDATLAPIDTVLWFRRYIADTISMEVTSDNAGSQQITVSLGVSSAFSGRRRPALAYFTDVDQRRRSADDRFCERTALYSQGVIKVWPKY